MRSTRQDYSHLAAEYDAVRFEGDNGRFLYDLDAAIVKELVSIAQATRQLVDFVLLDLPTGTGRVISYIDGLGIRTIGCDLSLEMLKLAKGRKTNESVELLQGDASNLPFPSGSFDCVVLLRFFHLFPQNLRQTFVQELDRVLRPGGFVLCSFTNRWYGCGLNLFRASIGRFGVYFGSSAEIAQLFPRWKMHALYGNYLPGQWLINKVTPGIDQLIRKTTKMAPLNRICFERFYLLQKPSI